MQGIVEYANLIDETSNAKQMHLNVRVQPKDKGPTIWGGLSFSTKPIETGPNEGKTMFEQSLLRCAKVLNVTRKELAHNSHLYDGLVGIPCFYEEEQSENPTTHDIETRAVNIHFGGSGGNPEGFQKASIAAYEALGLKD